MELSDEIIIPGNRGEVFAKLIDPTILKLCIPGCEELVEDEDGKLSTRVVLKIGPIKAKFNGKVSLDLTNGPTKYSLVGEGDGGVAGFAKGGIPGAIIGGIGGLFCDERVKVDIAPLTTTEVNDELAQAAFFVKELRECS